MNYQSEQKFVEGYLQKQKRRVKNGKISSLRYFKFSAVDKDHCFIMKVKQEDNSTLKIYNAKQIKGFTDKLTKEENIFGPNSNFSFKIITTIKQYVLCASKKGEFQSWMNTLQKFTEANSNQNNFTNFRNKYLYSNSVGQTQIEFQGVQSNLINLNSSSGGNSLPYNSKLKNNLDGISLNNSSKQDNSFGKKELKKIWDADEIISDEDKYILLSKVEAIVNKNNIGNAIMPQNGNFGSVGDFGTFGSNKKIISGPNSLAHHKGNQPSMGSMKNEDNNKINDNNSKKLYEIIPFESEDQNYSNKNSYQKSSASFKRGSAEKNLIPIDSFDRKNNSSIGNLNWNNYSGSKEEKIINRQKDDGITNNIYNNSINNSNKNKNQPSIGKFEILGETPIYPINKNFVFEGINKREEKGIIPLMENVIPLTTITANQFISNSQNTTYKIREREREQTIKSSAADSFKIGTTNFIVDFSDQDFFEISPSTPALAKKEEENSREFETLKSKQQPVINNSSSNSMSIENTKLNFGNNDIVSIKGQSRQNYEKYKFISEDPSKLPDNTQIYVKNQISTKDNHILNKTNTENIVSSGKLKIEESKQALENQNQVKTNFIRKDLSMDFPILKIKSDMKKENPNEVDDDMITKNVKNKISNNQPLITIFDENLMHIKQGLNSNNKMVLENLNFCPNIIYNAQEKPSLPDGNKSHSHQLANTKQILSSRKQGFKEETKMEVMQVAKRDMLDSLESQSENKDREINFSVKQNMINRILGTPDTNNIHSKYKKYMNTNVKKYPKDLVKIGSKAMIETPNIDYIQHNKNAIKVSIDKFAQKKDLNHMNVQNTYQLDAHTVLQDEFHMPMDKVVNFQHKQTQVYDYFDQTRSNIYLSNIHSDQSIIVGGFGDMDSDKTFLEEINKINQIHLSNSYSLLDVDEDWSSNTKYTKENYDSRFEI